MGCNTSDILGTAYRTGYAKLSARDLKVAAIAAACSTCNAQPLIEGAIGNGYLKLTEYETAMCIANALCSSPGATGAPAPIALAAAMQNHLASMSRRDLDAVITAVLCKQTNPPCVTPSAPLNPTAKVTTATTILVTWNQLPNAGSLILGYTVKWGTVSGVYPNTATVAAIPKSYTITGLTAGTQYFFVVVANSFSGCSSANSAESSATTTGAVACSAASQAFVAAWVATVVANGGAAPSAATQAAICAFQDGLVADGLDTQMLHWNAIVPDNLIAAFTPQLLGLGTRAVWTNSGPFVIGDLTVDGLKGDAVGKFSATGVAPSTIFSSDDDCGISIYLFTNPNSASCDIGVTQGANLTSIQPFAGTTFFDSYAIAGRISAANAGFVGFISGNRVAGPTTSIYEASSTVPFNTLVTANVAAGGNRPATEYYAWAMDNGGVQASLSDHRMSFIGFHHGLTAANDLKLFNRVQALRVALLGGFK